MNPRLKNLDIRKPATTSLRRRACRLTEDMLAAPPDPGQPLHEFLSGLPRTGLAARLVEAARALVQVALAGRETLWVLDAAFIEAGLSPLLLPMIQRGLLHGLAIDGTAAVRDFELAWTGRTCEVRERGLRDGMLGLSREAVEGMGSIVNEGVRRGFGLGECLARGIYERRPRYVQHSLLAACASRKIPVSIAVSIGADGFHRHPDVDGAMLGKGSQKDIHVLAARLAAMSPGGGIVALHRPGPLHEVLIQSLAQTALDGDPADDFTVIRLGPAPPPVDDVPAAARDFNLPAPLELLVPMFTGAVLSLVE